MINYLIYQNSDNLIVNIVPDTDPLVSSPPSGDSSTAYNGQSIGDTYNPYHLTTGQWVDITTGQLYKTTTAGSTFLKIVP